MDMDKFLEELDQLESYPPADIHIEHEVPFHAFTVGRLGRHKLVSKRSRHDPLRKIPAVNDMPFGLGPFEDGNLADEIVESHLTPSRAYDQNMLDHVQRIIPRDVDLEKCFVVPTSGFRTVLDIERDLWTEELILDSFEEVCGCAAKWDSDNRRILRTLR
ncbi:hypothetical protein BC829DRAFT_82937 [Chytridium lagenaria]|nr:hypothetical protein BC829DRAFT_82937 [Chytridium lagenaria]